MRKFRPAGENEAAAVFSLIQKRMAWMKDRGISQWEIGVYDKVYPLAYYARKAKKGELFVLTDENTRLAAAGVLLEADRRWEADPAPALYLHNFVSSPNAPGAGDDFLCLAEAQAKRSGKRFFRLDSAKENTALAAYYRSHGYEEAGFCTEGSYHGVLRQKRLCETQASVFLRPCTEADADTLRQLSIRTYSDTFAEMNTEENMQAYLRTAFSKERLLQELLNPHSSFFFLYADKTLAGYLKLNEAPAQTDCRDKDSLEIERIYLLNSFQKTGLGSYLMEQALSLARARRKAYVWLGVWEKNETALRFYQKHGFYRMGAHSFFMGDDEQHDLLLRRDL